MSNFRDQLQTLNARVKEYDEVQAEIEEYEAMLSEASVKKGDLMDSIHELIRGMNASLPVRPGESTAETDYSDYQNPDRSAAADY